VSHSSKVTHRRGNVTKEHSSQSDVRKQHQGSRLIEPVQHRQRGACGRTLVDAQGRAYGESPSRACRLVKPTKVICYMRGKIWLLRGPWSLRDGHAGQNRPPD
jgi:hypothetical protein